MLEDDIEFRNRTYFEFTEEYGGIIALSLLVLTMLFKIYFEISTGIPYLLMWVATIGFLVSWIVGLHSQYRHGKGDYSNISKIWILPLWLMSAIIAYIIYRVLGGTVGLTDIRLLRILIIVGGIALFILVAYSAKKLEGLMYNIGKKAQDREISRH